MLGGGCRGGEEGGRGGEEGGRGGAEGGSRRFRGSGFVSKLSKSVSVVAERLRSEWTYSSRFHS